MSEFPENAYNEDELTAEFDCLFPQGFAGGRDAGTRARGWEKSKLLAVFHPSLDQVYEERRAHSPQPGELRKPMTTRPELPETTREEIAKSFRNRPSIRRGTPRPRGPCLWDVFSDNHEVFDATGGSSTWVVPGRGWLSRGLPHRDQPPPSETPQTTARITTSSSRQRCKPRRATRRWTRRRASSSRICSTRPEPIRLHGLLPGKIYVRGRADLARSTA